MTKHELLTAVELGYKLCEKGNNLQSTLDKAGKIYDSQTNKEKK